MNPSDKDKWAKAHYGHDTFAASETARRASDQLVTTVIRPHTDNRAMYGYDYGASDLKVTKAYTHGGVDIERNGRSIAQFYGADKEIDAALMAQASTMRNLLINVLDGNVNLAEIHAVLQRATLKR